jgi:hypothetical protein
LTILAGLLMSGCASTTDPGPVLSTDEANGLVQVLVAASIPIGPGTRDCDGGGTVTTLSDSPSYLLTYSACRGSSGAGLSFEFGGSMTITKADAMTGLFTGITSSWSGDIAWRLEDRSGSCAVALSRFSRGSMYGTVCGITIG